MSIYYTLIANKKDNVICEYTDKLGNFQQVSRILLSKAIEKETNQAMEFKDKRFHSINENGLTYLCLSEDLDDQLIMSYLKDIQRRLISQYDWEYITSASAYKLSAFENQIKELIEYYQGKPRVSVSGQLINDLNEVKQVVVKNIQELMDRENTLELTIYNSDKLKDSAVRVNNFVSDFLIVIIM